MMRALAVSVTAWLCLVLPARGATPMAVNGLRLATFRCAATPPAGEPLIWDVPLTSVQEPLWAKGLVLEQHGQRLILCTFDWCEVCNDADLFFRQRIAAAAQTDVARVALHAVHQHAAPYADQAAHRYLDQAQPPVRRLSDRFLEELGDRLAQAVRAACGRLEPFDRVGIAAARVERVASTRRLRNPDGSITVRYSGAATDPKLAAATEGDIDSFLRTITLARGPHPLARLHFYATHPQTFCCDGQASADFVGWARETLEHQEGVFQLYFTGCAGDVTAGKYNDGTLAARQALGQRLLAGMEAARAATRWEPVRSLRWRSVALSLPPAQGTNFARDALLAQVKDPKGAAGSRVYSGAIRLAFQDRLQRPLVVHALELGSASILTLPGEPMIEFQRFAQRARADRFVAVGGYFDCGPGYLCTDAAFREGGYEPTATHAGVGTQAKLEQAIVEALGGPAGRTWPIAKRSP